MDLIDRQAAVAVIHSLYPSAPILRKNRELWKKKYEPYIEAEKALEQMPSAQPEDCDTCKHGYFGDGKCDNCRVRFPSHYERRADEGN